MLHPWSCRNFPQRSLQTVNCRPQGDEAGTQAVFFPSFLPTDHMQLVTPILPS